MRVAVLTPEATPPIFGGAQRLWSGLVEWINGNTPHTASAVAAPVAENSLPDLLDSYAAAAALDLSAFDLVISGKYPSWIVAHPNHVVYMLHPLRGLYDTYGGFGVPRHLDEADPVAAALGELVSRPPDRHALSDVVATFRDAFARHGHDHPAFAFPGPLARRAVHWLDRVALDRSSIRAHFAISQTVASRADYFPPGVRAQALLPPSNLGAIAPRSRTHFLHTGRLDAPKRVDLVIEAFRRVPGDATLKITGRGPEEARLRALAAPDPRVEFVGHVGDEALRELYADAIAVAVVPLDEDFGLVALEAMAASKPVITTTDAGGPRELVAHRHTGLVVPPEAVPLAEAFTLLARDDTLANDLAAAGSERAMRITWAGVANPLLGTTKARRRPQGRPRVVVTSTFPVYPNVGGGQIRVHRLHRALADRVDVDVVSLGPCGSEAATADLGDGYRETIVPMSHKHLVREWEIEQATGLAVTDIVAAPLMRYTPAYIDALSSRLDGAIGAVAAHPFLHPLVAKLAPDLPTVYDAHNYERSLKRAVLPDRPVGNALVELVEMIERDAYLSARVVTACSEQDAAALRAMYGEATIRVVPNGVDIETTPFTTIAERRRNAEAWISRFDGASGRWRHIRHLAVFIGSWHPPNVDALGTILDLAPTLPHVGFIVSGSVGIQVDHETLPDNVAVTGVVSELTKRGLLASADVALNPVATGSGTNLKMVEYFAAGVPTVSTPTATRGLGIEADRHALVCEPDEFAAAITSLLHDPARADALVRSARRLAEDRYDWRAIGADYADIVVSSLGLSDGVR